eukprot:g14247.t1
MAGVNPTFGQEKLEFKLEKASSTAGPGVFACAFERCTISGPELQNPCSCLWAISVKDMAVLFSVSQYCTPSISLLTRTLPCHLAIAKATGVGLYILMYRQTPCVQAVARKKHGLLIEAQYLPINDTKEVKVCYFYDCHIRANELQVLWPSHRASTALASWLIIAKEEEGAPPRPTCFPFPNKSRVNSTIVKASPQVPKPGPSAAGKESYIVRAHGPALEYIPNRSRQSSLLMW